jgi:protein involved in polysaccharide export with SLBB domain
LVSHPEVNVLVKEHRSKPITVVGAVGHPMVYEADRTVTLLEVLAEAGGVSNDAGDTIIITRAHPSFVLIPTANPEPPASAPPGAAPAADSPAPDPPDASAGDSKSPQNSSAFPSAAELAQHPAPPVTSPAPSSDATTPSSPSANIITINLRDLLETGDTRNNIPLQAGDVVTVPHAGIVYVLGAVNRAGGFVLSNDRSQMTTLKIMALCGGATRTAKLDHAVIIRKDEQGKQTETEVDLKKVLHQETEDVQMRASDILYVPDSHTKQVLYQGLTIAAAVATAVAIYRVAGY